MVITLNGYRVSPLVRILLNKPTSAQLVLALSSTGLVDYVIADYLWARAVLLLGPTLATVGMSAQIPMATIADVFIGQPTWLKQPSTTAVTAAGTVAILAGFIGSNWSPAGDLEGREGAGDSEGSDVGMESDFENVVQSGREQGSDVIHALLAGELGKDIPEHARDL